MKFHIITSAWKKEERWEPYVGIRDWPDDATMEFKELRGHVRYVLEEKRCIGFATHVPRYFHQPCGSKAINVVKCPDCSSRNLSHICERCDGSECKIPALNYYCRSPHILYLAAFSPDHIKIGTSSQNSFENRIVEQGALFACGIASIPDKFHARILEETVSKGLHVPERVRTADKERYLRLGVNKSSIVEALVAVRQRITESEIDGLSPFLLDNPTIIDLDHFFGYGQILDESIPIQVPKYKAGEIIEGNVVAAIGPFMLLRNAMALTLANIAHLQGWVIDTDVGGVQQSDLGRWMS